MVTNSPYLFAEVGASNGTNILNERKRAHIYDGTNSPYLFAEVGASIRRNDASAKGRIYEWLQIAHIIRAEVGASKGI